MMHRYAFFLILILSCIKKKEIPNLTTKNLLLIN